MNIFGMAGHLIRRLNQVSTHVFATRMQQAGLDLTPVQFAALDAVHANPGLDQSGIAVCIAYDRATIGGVIDRLQQKGLVTRKVSERDRRAREVWLSDAGRRIHAAALPVVAALQAEILAGLTDAERRDFLRLSEKALRLSPDKGADGKGGKDGTGEQRD